MNVTFFMEQQVGHRSYYQNLRKGIEALTGITSKWVEVTYVNADGQQSGLSLLPTSIRGSFTGRKQVLEGFKRYPADVYFYFTQVPAALAGRSIRRPYVLATDITPVQYDGMAEAYGHRVDSLPFVTNFKHAANVRLMRGAARLVPWSQWVCASLVEDYGVDRRKIEIVPPGIDLAFWRPGPARKTDDKMRILFVGGDFERKGGPMLLEAFRTLPSGMAELVLVTRSDVSPGADIEVYRNMKPNTPELLALYQSSDVLVLPTHAESFGTVTLEASAVGLPVIASTVGALTEIIVDGETGYLVAPGDVRALADRLRRLVNDRVLLARLGQGARQRVESNFDLQQHAKRIAEILSEVVLEGEAI